MSKIALIADEAVLPPLALSGISVFAGQTASKFSKALSDVAADGGYKAVFVTEEIAALNAEEIAASDKVNLVVIPGLGGKDGFFRSVIDQLTMKATGAE